MLARHCRLNVLAALAALATGTTPAEAEMARTPMALVSAGTYRPLFPPNPNETEIQVRSFWLDKTPVTNRDYLLFVTAHPEWRRDRVAPVFAEATYLQQW